jgi:hypothetical protein
VPEYWILWMWNGLMRFAHFRTIKSVLSNAAVLRQMSRNGFGVPMENGHPMSRREVASELPHSDEVCDPP